MSNTEAYYEASEIVCKNIYKKLKSQIRNASISVRVDNYSDILNIDIYRDDIGHYRVQYRGFVDGCLKRYDSDKIVNDVLRQYKSEILNKYFYDPRKIQTL